MLLSGLSYAQNLHWDTAGVDLGKEATILLGDQLNLVLEGTQVPAPQELSQNDILLLSLQIDTATGRALYVATSFEEGLHRLGLGDDSVTLIVEDIPGVDTTKADIKDIAHLMKEPYTFWEIFRWILLALVALALAFAIVYLAKRRASRTDPLSDEPKPSPLPPHEVALNELEALRVRELWQKGMVKEYHTELTDILRRYLCDRFGIESQEMTSDQTLEAYEETRPTVESLSLLRTILRTADMVKFAKAEPQPQEHDRSMAQAKEFIQAQPSSPLKGELPSGWHPHSTLNTQHSTLNKCSGISYYRRLQCLA